MEKDESKKLRRPLFQASSFFLSRSLSRFVIENVDGLIFRDISFQFFSRKMGEWGKTERLLDFPLSERWFVYSSTCTLF